MISLRLRVCFTWLFLSLVFSSAALAQTQIGDDLVGEFENDLFGSSVALSADGSRMVVGAITSSMGSGQVRVFENINGSWVQLGQNINGTGLDARLGRGVAISADGTIIAAGADAFDDGSTGTGKVLAFELINGSWNQLGQDLLGSENNSRSFGNEVCLSADGLTLAVGAPGGSTGSASVYRNMGGTWVQLGNNIVGEAPGAALIGFFGNGLSLSADGLRVAIGGDGLSGAGVLRVFDFDFVADDWTQVGQTVTGEGGDRIGTNVAISGDGSTVAVSAVGNSDMGANSGAVRVYEDTGGIWTQIGGDLNGTPSNQFGASLSFSNDGSILAVGAFGNGAPATIDADGVIVPGEGPSARIFRNENNDWVELARISGEVDSFFGLQSNLSSDGLTLAVGAQSFDENGTDRGLVRVFDLEELISVLHGDVNLDGVVDFLDISPFILVLATGEFQIEADCDGNGVVDFLDISPFILALSSQ